MDSTGLQFNGSQGHMLEARLDLPDSQTPIAFGLFAHCFTCSKNYKSVVNISKALTERQIGVLRFDFTGLGESRGNFADTTFSTNVDDIVSAAHFMESRYQPPKLLIGHSFGGAAVIRAALSIPSVRAVATIAAPYDPSHLIELLGLGKKFEGKSTADITVAGRTFTLKKQFLDDLGNLNAKSAIRELDKPLMIFHSPVDRVVSIDNAAKIFQAARHPKSFISLDTADHLLSDESDSRYVGYLIAEWVSRYIHR